MHIHIASVHTHEFTHGEKIQISERSTMSLKVPVDLSNIIGAIGWLLVGSSFTSAFRLTGRFVFLEEVGEGVEVVAVGLSTSHSGGHGSLPSK